MCGWAYGKEGEEGHQPSIQAVTALDFSGARYLSVKYMAPLVGYALEISAMLIASARPPAPPSSHVQMMEAAPPACSGYVYVVISVP